MKSFLTGLLVELAALFVCVYFFKLYFLHMKRLLIFVITTLNICFLHWGRLQKKSACQTSGTCPSVQNLIATRLSTEDQLHATWQAHGCHIAQLPLSDQFTWYEKDYVTRSLFWMFVIVWLLRMSCYYSTFFCWLLLSKHRAQVNYIHWCCPH